MEECMGTIIALLIGASLGAISVYSWVKPKMNKLSNQIVELSKIDPIQKMPELSENDKNRINELQKDIQNAIDDLDEYLFNLTETITHKHFMEVDEILEQLYELKSEIGNEDFSFFYIFANIDGQTESLIDECNDELKVLQEKVDKIVRS